jgi:tetratricopeptide (TPR) repeat protein
MMKIPMSNIQRPISNRTSSIRLNSRPFPWKLDIGYWILDILVCLKFFTFYVKSRESFYVLRKTSLAALGLALLAPLAASAQLGPWPIQTRQAAFEATIIKRDGDILWVQRQSSDGQTSPQVGLAVADIVQAQMSRPSLFDAVDKIRAAPAATDAQLAAAHAALDKFILQIKSLRDIPGIPANEALILKGRLYDAKGLWRESTRIYEEILAKSIPSATTTNAQMLAGIAYAKGGEYNQAIEYLGGIPLPEADEELLSNLLFALGDSYFALENYDNALLSYLPLVVFYPYVYDNEPRGLAAALGCYAKLKEWEPLYRSIQEIQKNYPHTPAAKTAEEFLAEYHDDLVNAGQFVDATKITTADAAAAPVVAAAPAAPATSAAPAVAIAEDKPEETK